MSPAEDKDDATDNLLNFDLSDTETQPPDDAESPGGEFEKMNHDEDEQRYMQDTMLVDDLNRCGDALETQVVDADEDFPIADLINETQRVNADEEIPVFDLMDETQLVDPGNEVEMGDLGGETQIVEELDNLENIFSTQVLDGNDATTSDSDQETGRTEALCAMEEVSDVNLVKRSAMHAISEENFLKLSLPEQKDGFSRLDASSDEEHRSGSVHSGFTSIRAASIRASGLAARRMALERANGKSFSPRSDSSPMRQHAEHTGLSDVRDLHNIGKEQLAVPEVDCEQMKELRDGNRFSVCSSTVRKLFAEDTTAETKQPDGGLNDLNDKVDPPNLEYGMAGLSYINSQEPGDLSQANALEFVNDFLKVNIIEAEEDVGLRKSIVGDSKAFSSAKGARTLAKTAIPRTPYDNNATFDWDDNREDEGGGEFFRKTKDLFFDDGTKKRKCFTQPRKPKSLDFKKSEVVENSLLSDSRIGSRRIRGSGKLSGLVKDLNEDLNKQLNGAPDDGLLDTCTGKNVPNMQNVGPDTQIAVEAIETLCFGVAMPENDFRNAGEDLNNKTKGYLEDGTCSKLPSEQRASREKPCLLNVGDVRRQPRRSKRSCVQSSREVSFPSAPSESVKNICDFEAIKVKSKSSKVVAEKCLGKKGGGNLNNGHSVICEQHKGKRTSKISESESHRVHITAVASGGEKMNCGLQEELGFFTPIAHRTRRSRLVNPLNSAGKDSIDSSKEMKDLAGVPVARKRSKRNANVSESLVNKEATNHAVDVREAKSVCIEASDPRCSGACVVLKTDAVSIPRGKRTRRNLHLSSEAVSGYNTRSSRLSTDAIGTSIEGATVCSTKALDESNKESDGKDKRSADGAETTGRVDSTPKDGSKQSASACTTQSECRTPVNASSPICMGDEYHKQTCKKRLSRSPLMKEVYSLTMTGAKPLAPDSRRRREMADVQVLFSHHLDADVIRQQKKILLRLGASEVSSMSDATHFITDIFVRTRNMLEAIALGKPVVTHLWLESCGQASCFIDEKNFILRDARKEKEIGFSMPVSLAQACQHPLLQGQRVLITPNTKPSKEILTSLVKAVGGLAVERLGRSALMDKKLPDDLLILSCEEDREMCLPFLEKGAIYSSELLLNGIVTQKLEYERHRLFLDYVKSTRSTIRVKKNNKQFLPVRQRK